MMTRRGSLGTGLQEASRPAPPFAGKLGWGLLCLLMSLPAPLLRGLGKVLAWLRFKWDRKQGRILADNLSQVWGLPWQSSFARLFAKQVMGNQLMTALETLKGIFYPACLQVEGFEDLQRQMQAQEGGGQGQLVITAHLGSWELVGHYCAQASTRPFYALAKPARSALVTHLMQGVRAKMGTHVLWTGGKALPRHMLAVLKEGAWLGFVMDQKPLGRQGPVVSFFGRETAFVSGPALMAVKEGRAVVAVFCLRLGRGHYRLHSKVLLEAGHEASDVQVVTQLMAAEIERTIRLYPEQWCWDYKRWRF